MMDMVLSQGSDLFVYYNKHKHLKFNNDLDEIYLCIKWTDTSSMPIFQDYKDLSRDEIRDGGNEYVVI